MATWTLRRGFPILMVDPPPRKGEKASIDEQGRPVVTLAQVPFHAPRSFEVGTPYTSVRARACVRVCVLLLYVWILMCRWG
jgi:hypothetical protein